MEEAEACERDDGSSSPGGRATKRPRRDDVHRSGTCCGISGPLQLPPEIWVGVLGYLPFQSILRCGAVSQSILRDVMPLLTALHIDKSAEMNLDVARRFRDVETIHINSLLSLDIQEAGAPDEWAEANVDFDSMNRLVPFLSRFYKLRRVAFGGNLDDFDFARGYFWENVEGGYPNLCSRERMLQVLDTISIGYQCGALPKHLQISGLSCPDATEGRGNRQCQTCLRACKSFPIDSVVGFECKGSSRSNALSGRSHGLDVCLERAQIESVVESRPGGAALLRSEERVLRLLSSGRRYKVPAQGGSELYIVKYEEAELEEIQRVINYAEINTRELPPRQISDAMMRSFASNDGRSVPPTRQCYMVEESLDHLKDRVGLRFDREEFERPLMDLAKYVRQIAWVLFSPLRHSAQTYRVSYEKIEGDCLRLARRFVDEIERPPIEEISNSIPRLIALLYERPLREDALRTLKVILAKGTDEHKMKIIGTRIQPGAIHRFCSCLGSSESDSVIVNAISALRVIFMDRRQMDIEAFARAGGIDRCIDLLDSEHCDVARDSLFALAAAKDHISPSAAHQLLPHLVRVLKSEDSEDIMCANCLELVRHTEADNPPTRELVDPAVTSRLAHIVMFTNDEMILANGEHALINIVCGSTEDHVAVLMKETPQLLTVLLGLQDSRCAEIAEKAVSTLHSIASSSIVGTWTSWKRNDALAWGEFKVSGDLVDFVGDDDERSDLSEAEEVSDEQLDLEEEQVAAMSHPMQTDATDNVHQSPSLLGLPNQLLAKILDLATCPLESPDVLPLNSVSDALPLERVCKRIRRIMQRDDFWTSRHKVTVGLRRIREFQKRTDNEIVSVLGGESGSAETVRDLSADLLSKMIHVSAGPGVNCRLRGDTIWFLAEMLQGYMVEKLSQALLAAVNRHRATVQREDVLFVFRKEFHSFPAFVTEDANGANQPGNCERLDLSRYLPFPSGIVWRWPEDDSCCDVMPPDAGRRIIRRLAYRAGICEMSGDAFAIAEAELLYAWGMLLADAYESSVKLAKAASYLTADDVLVYRKPAVSGDILVKASYFSATDSTANTEQTTSFVRQLDMFNVPPPPFRVPRWEAAEGATEDEDEDCTHDTVYTIVPGQLIRAAEQRNMKPSNVFGDGWVTVLGDEMMIEESYYYGAYDEDFPDCFYDTDVDDEKHSENSVGRGVDKTSFSDDEGGPTPLAIAPP